jgi:hypothetical protein
MKNGNVIFKYVAVICIPIYVIFTFISHLYNTKINPLTNWLSDFGNPLKNPSGALFYNLGCIFVASLLIVFYIGIYQWYKNRKIAKKYIISYVCAQISGIIASIFLVLASIFPLGNNTDLHSTFSLINMIGIDCFLSFTATAFLMNPNIKKWIGITAYLVAVFNIVTTNAFSSLYIAEWIYFLLFMIYMLIITMNYDKIVQHEICPVEKWTRTLKNQHFNR